jgi:murein DD-endopeptidase MepM/ murein hydrolase activator NlpD
MKVLLEYPVKDRTVSQPFGFDCTNHPQRKNFYTLFENKHPGIDFQVNLGTEVYSAYPGIVVRNENHKGMGKVIGIRNGNIIFLYTHLSQTKVKLGQTVDVVKLIGYSGDTGEACLEPHLHFELRDLSKNSLKDMVLNPTFNKKIAQYQDTFIYRVNNKNTQKTLENLSILYFGTNKYWGTISKHNKILLKYSKGQYLEENLNIIIPNYTEKALKKFLTYSTRASQFCNRPRQISHSFIRTLVYFSCGINLNRWWSCIWEEYFGKTYNKNVTGQWRKHYSLGFRHLR